MDEAVVLRQMTIMLIFLIIGYASRRKEKISDTGTREFSWLMVNICNPALILYSVMASENRPPLRNVLVSMLAGCLMFALQIVLGAVMGRLLRTARDDRKSYNMLTVFGNIGFLGMPLVQAVLGEDALLYVAVALLLFNLLVYTYGVFILRGSGEKKGGWKKIINVGTISSVLALVIYFTGVRFPALIQDAVRYTANVVTFLSMFIIGANLTKMPLRTVFTDAHMYVFIAIRQILYPLLFVLLLKHLVTDPLLVSTFALLAAVPPANISVMLAKLYDCDTDVLTRGIVLGTILSAVTIPIAAMAV